jgi:hypothetical protein
MSQIVRPENDSLVAVALASGLSLNAAAEQAGVCRKTVERRLADPAFRREVAEFRGQLIAAALGRLADNMTRAADAVAALLDDPDPRLRLRAARTLFNSGLRLRNLEAELARRGSAWAGGAACGRPCFTRALLLRAGPRLMTAC